MTWILICSFFIFPLPFFEKNISTIQSYLQVSFPFLKRFHISFVFFLLASTIYLSFIVKKWKEREGEKLIRLYVYLTFNEKAILFNAFSWPLSTGIRKLRHSSLTPSCLPKVGTQCHITYLTFWQKLKLKLLNQAKLI